LQSSSIILAACLQYNSRRETPKNTRAAGGIGGCGIILDAGASENGLRR
jgi:hypothetical protein